MDNESGQGFTNPTGIDIPEPIQEWLDSYEGATFIDEIYQMAFDEGYDNGFTLGVAYGGANDGDEES